MSLNKSIYPDHYGWLDKLFFSVYGTQRNPHNFKREQVEVFLCSSKNQLKLTSWNYLTVFDVYKRCRALREMVTASGYDPRAVFELLLNTAQFELKLKEVCNHHHDLYFYGLPFYLCISDGQNFTFLVLNTDTERNL